MNGAATLSEDKRKLLALTLRGALRPRQEARIERRAENVDPPLSIEQELIWVHCQLAPELPLYNEVLTVTRRGPLDAGALERALTEILRRHEAWRTTFEARPTGVVQIVHPPAVASIRREDLAGVSEAQKEAEAARLALTAARTPFDLAAGPLVRFVLVRISEVEHRLYVVTHQIVHDGVSVYAVFLPELAALYESFARGERSALPEPAVRYGDYAAWQRARTLGAPSSEAVDYWRRQLAGAPPALELPTDRARAPGQSFAGRQVSFSLPEGLAERLRRFSRRSGVTLYVTLLAAFKVLLYRYSGQGDLVVGTAVSSRRLPETERVVGVFLNTAAIRTRLTEDHTFRRAVEDVKQAVAEALSHAEIPFHLLLKELAIPRDPSRSPVFQAMFVFEPPTGAAPADWEINPMAVDTGISRVDLCLQLEDRPGALSGRVRYRADLWEPSTIEGFLRHYENLLDGVVEHPEVAVFAAPILHPGVAAARLVEERIALPSNAFERFEATDLAQSLVARFRAMAARHGGRAAVVADAGTQTYAELARSAEKVARAIRRTGPDAGSRVAVLADQDAAMVAGLLGVLASGCAYVPLDAAQPKRRLEEMMADAGARAILASPANRALAEELSASGAALLDLASILEGELPEAPLLDVPPDALAYILYTSGSTGTPKGVAQVHRNVLHFIAAYTSGLHLCASDRLTLLPSYGVDAGVMDVFGAVLNGAALCPIDVRGVGLRGTLDRIARLEASVWHGTPSLFRHLTATRPDPLSLAKVRLVVLGGEEASCDDADRFKRSFPRGCLLVNGLGPTESTVSLQSFFDHDTPVERRSLPVGRPVERTEVALLSPAGQPGQVFGEIAIRSRHVAPGYWRDPELTRRSFVADAGGGGLRTYRTGDMGRLLPDGQIAFCGRRDLQTKIRGVRVELAEIERAIAACPGVRDAATTVFGDDETDKRVVAYFVADADPPPTDAMLRASLRQRLPDAMMPGAFVRLNEIPLTRSGKVDRRALPRPEVTPLPPRAQQPSGDTQRTIADIWKDVLGLASVGPDDDFFAKGGHSLAALRMMAEIRRLLGVELVLSKLFEAPTVAELAALVDEERGAARGPSLVSARTSGDCRPLFCVHGRSTGPGLFDELSRRLGAAHLLHPVRSRALHDGSSAAAAPDVAASLELVTAIQPSGPYCLVGHAEGGDVAIEMARQLVERRERVALLALFWAPAAAPSIAARVRAALGWSRAAGATERLGEPPGASAHPAGAAYEGPVTVYASGARRPEVRREIGRSLSGVSPSLVEIVDVPGDSGSMLRGSAVHVVASHLADALARTRPTEMRSS